MCELMYALPLFYISYLLLCPFNLCINDMTTLMLLCSTETKKNVIKKSIFHLINMYTLCPKHQGYHPSVIVQ